MNLDEVMRLAQTMSFKTDDLNLEEKQRLQAARDELMSLMLQGKAGSEELQRFVDRLMADPLIRGAVSRVKKT